MNLSPSARSLAQKKMNQEGYVLLLRRDPEEGPINISETWENYDHIIKEETPENAYRMIDFLLWTPWFRCINKGIGNTAMRTQISKEERRKKWKQNRYQSRNKSSAIVGEGMEAYASLKKSLTSSCTMLSSPYSCKARKHKHKALDGCLMLLQEPMATKND
jgi:hypothetical protein